MGVIKITLIGTLDLFLRSRKMLGLVDKSILNYKDFCMKFINFVSSDLNFEKVTQNEIENYILHLMNSPLSKTSIATYIRHMKIYLKWCSENIDNCNYDYKKIKIPKSPKKNVKIYTDAEIETIFESIKNSIDWITVRNQFVISLMLDSGLRQAEITRVALKDFNFMVNVINVHGKGNKDRYVSFGKTTEEYFKLYISVCPIEFKQNDYLFLGKDFTRITTNAIKQMIFTLSQKLDFELSSHKLRHNYATNYCINQYHRSGQIDIYQLMYLLGHEDLKTTMRYLHMAYEFIATQNSISHLDHVFSN